MRRAAVMAFVLCGCRAFGEAEQFTVSGRVVVETRARASFAPAAGERTISHVMAVNPQSASAQRSLAAVAGDGSFSLAIETGKPYVLVFVDDTAVGADMAVAVLRAGTLD